jgi:hypothetical protein
MNANAKGAAGALIGMLLGGCIPLPNTHSSAPDISPSIPAEVRSSDRQVMVLVQSMLQGKGLTIGTPKFVRANALDAVTRNLGIETRENVILPGVPGVPLIIPQISSVVVGNFSKLCLVTMEGWEISLTVLDERWKMKKGPGSTKSNCLLH